MDRWIPAPLPVDELDRLSRLQRLGLGLGQHHPFLDRVTQLAASILDAPIALVTLITDERQLFLSRFGISGDGTGRRESFCGHCITMQKALVVPDVAQDDRFVENPLVVGAPNVRAYLGVPLFSGPAQTAVGALCVVDRSPHAWSAREQTQLAHLGALVETYLDDLAARRTWYDSPLSFVVLDREGRVVQANPAFERFLGRPLEALRERPLAAFVVPADRGLVSAMVSSTLESKASPTRRELRFARLSGEVVHGGTSMSPLTDVDEQLVCVIRDISLERRSSARSGVIAEVRSELGVPLRRAQLLLEELRAQASSPDEARCNELAERLRELDALLDARVGDIAEGARVAEELRASDQRLRSLMEHVLGPLLVLDDRGRIVDANTSALLEFGWKYEHLLGSPMSVVLPTFSESDCRRWFETAAQRTSADLSLVHEQAHFVRRDGSELAVDLQLIHMDWNGPGRLVVVARDVTAARNRESKLLQEREELATRVRTGDKALTEQQAADELLKRSLDEKEILLKEIHHRVKNNLQMVSSLLTLQMDQMPEGRPRELLLESVHRVRSMALIHQHLYGSASLQRVDLGTYARDLAESLRHALAPACRLQLTASHIELAVEQAAPICLILNELLTNAFKYGARRAAVDGPTEHDVVVKLDADARMLRLHVRDHGPGLPEDFDVKQHTSLGLQLVLSLTRQLRGRIETRSADGAIFLVECPR